MNSMDLLHPLSGSVDPRLCGREGEPVAPPSATRKEGAESRPRSVSERRVKRVFAKYCRLLAILLFGSLALVVLPLWLVYPPYGEACLLSLPPMVLCALSWMAAAKWAWSKGGHILMAVTVGAIPIRLFLLLGWVWLVISIPGVAIAVFVLALMWHWLVFSTPEFGMLLELSRARQHRPGHSAGQGETHQERATA